MVFGEYERDENECKVTLKQIAKGHRCDAAVLLMPIADVLLHPEYKHFGIKSSIALLKLLTPVKSSKSITVLSSTLHVPYINDFFRPSDVKSPSSLQFYSTGFCFVYNQFARLGLKLTRVTSE